MISVVILSFLKEAGVKLVQMSVEKAVMAERVAVLAGLAMGEVEESIKMLMKLRKNIRG